MRNLLKVTGLFAALAACSGSGHHSSGGDDDSQVPAVDAAGGGSSDGHMGGAADGGGSMGDVDASHGADACDAVADTGCSATQDCKAAIRWVLDSGVISGTGPTCVPKNGLDDNWSDYICKATEECIAGWSCVLLLPTTPGEEGQCREMCHTPADCTPSDGVVWSCESVDGIDVGICVETLSPA